VLKCRFHHFFLASPTALVNSSTSVESRTLCSFHLSRY
jgi:hypothetical protein